MPKEKSYPSQLRTNQSQRK